MHFHRCVLLDVSDYAKLSLIAYFNGVSVHAVVRCTSKYEWICFFCVLCIVLQAHVPDAKTAEKYLVLMMSRREIYGRIDQASGIVYFHEKPEQEDHSQIDGQIASGIMRESRMLSLLTSMNQDIETNSSFLKRKLDISAPQRLIAMETGDKEDEELYGM